MSAKIYTVRYLEQYPPFDHLNANSSEALHNQKLYYLNYFFAKITGPKYLVHGTSLTAGWLIDYNSPLIIS